MQTIAQRVQTAMTTPVVAVTNDHVTIGMPVRLVAVAMIGHVMIAMIVPVTIDHAVSAPNEANVLATTVTTAARAQRAVIGSTATNVLATTVTRVIHATRDLRVAIALIGPLVPNAQTARIATTVPATIAHSMTA